MHLEDAFIQSDLALKRIWSVLACPGIWTYDLGIAILLLSRFSVGHLVLVMYYILHVFNILYH